MKKTMRACAAVLAVVFVLFVAVSLSTVVIEAGHDCSGEHCPVCRLIVSLTQTLRISALFIPVMAAVMAVSGMGRGAYAFIRQTEHTAATPVKLKTKLSN